MNYLIVSYRPNHTDYCRSCEMDRTDSDFEMFETTDEFQAIQFLSRKMVASNSERSQHKFSSDRENYIFINGVNWTGQSEFEGKAQILANEIIAEQKLEDEEFQKKQVDIQKEYQKNWAEKEIERLKRILENS